jgi:hypothetical protein
VYTLSNSWPARFEHHVVANVGKEFRRCAVGACRGAHLLFGDAAVARIHLLPSVRPPQPPPRHLASASTTCSNAAASRRSGPIRSTRTRPTGRRPDCGRRTTRGSGANSGCRSPPPWGRRRASGRARTQLGAVLMTGSLLEYGLPAKPHACGGAGRFFSALSPERWLLDAPAVHSHRRGAELVQASTRPSELRIRPNRIWRVTGRLPRVNQMNQYDYPLVHQ